MVATRQEIMTFARLCCLQSSQVADRLELSARMSTKATEGVTENVGIGADPRFQLDVFGGVKAMSAILSVDLRKSSQRAIAVGPRSTYITMHTLLAYDGGASAEGRGFGHRTSG